MLDAIGHKILPWLDDVLTETIQVLGEVQDFVKAWRALWT